MVICKRKSGRRKNISSKNIHLMTPPKNSRIKTCTEVITTATMKSISTNKINSHLHQKISPSLISIWKGHNKLTKTSKRNSSSWCKKFLTHSTSRWKEVYNRFLESNDFFFLHLAPARLTCGKKIKIKILITMRSKLNFFITVWTFHIFFYVIL